MNQHDREAIEENDISKKRQNILQMTDYQQRISELLELCQQEWVLLEQLIKENKATTSISHAAKDLRDGIKKLVQLQDNLDEIGNIVENNTEWNKRADILMEDVRKRLQFASKLTSKVQPMPSHSSPLRLSATQTFKDKLKRAQENIQEEEDEDEEQFLDASEELPEQEFRQLDLTVEPTSSSDIIKTSRSNSSSTSTTSSIKSLDNHKPFGRRSIIATDDMITFAPSESITTVTEKKKIGLFPLLKMGSLRTSQSTPIRNKKDAPAQINFYKEDQQKKDGFIFATDAIVDHPLRIGVGYGSYICYQCTILSDKGAPITVRKRYSDFVELREELLKEFPTYKKSIPKLPPKKVVGKFTPAFVEQRRRELEYFFKYVCLHPIIGAAPTVRNWIAP